MSFELEAVSTTVRAEVESTVKALLDGGTITEIQNGQQFENANTLLQLVKAKKKYLEELRADQLAPLRTKTDAINDYFRQFVDLDKKNPQGQLDILENKIKVPMIAFQRAEEQRRIEAQRKADEEARRQREAAEAEARKKREAEEKARREAEEKRRQAEEAARREALAKEEAERKRRAAAEATSRTAKEKAEREAREAEARAQAEAEAKAQAEKEALKADRQADRNAAAADQALEVQSSVVPQVIQSAAKAKGFSVAKTYKAEVVDEEAFKLWCMQNDKLHYLLVDTKLLNKAVKVEGLNFKAHGIRVAEDFSARSQAA
jgi:membrane protein involved in colicin uptake